MARQSFLWTALPNGYTRDGSGLCVSVLLSPRLDPENQPSELTSFFPDWEDWPATLSKATLKISYGGTSVTVPVAQTAGTNRVDDTLGTADSACWRALFHGKLFVRGFQYKDLSNNIVLSYDTTSMAALVQTLYAKLARSADGEMPRVADIADDADWAALVSAVKAVDAGFADQDTGLRNPRAQFRWLYEGGDKATWARGGYQVTQALTLFQLFHTPPATPKPVTQKRRDDDRITARWLEYERAKLPGKTDIVKELDFHQIVAAMNSYPTLLRRLGLVIDLILDKRAFHLAPNQLLTATADFPPDVLRVPNSQTASPATHALLSAAKFQAVPNPAPQPTDPRIVDGLLDLDPQQFDILQVDVDGAGLKVMGFARSLARFHPADAGPEPDDRLAPRTNSVTKYEKDLGAPSLRTAGLMLVHKSRSTMLKNRFATNKTKNAAVEKIFQNQPNAVAPDLWAEDLVRGYRIDVWDQTTDLWRSLCQRLATYQLGDGVVVIPNNPEEGTLRLAATKSADPTSNQNLLYLHEALVSWTGWSLAAPMPGRAIKGNDEVDKTSAQTNAELPPGMKFQSQFRALPKSLPRLRFGRNYSMRARVVDLAGNSLTPQEKSFGPEDPGKNARPYLRYEPLAAPIMALVKPQGAKTERPAEGESIARIVIRSFNDQLSDNSKVTSQSARRFAVPPQSSVRDAESHGKLDAGGKVDGTTFDLIANRKDLDASDPQASLREEVIPMRGPLDPAPVKTLFAIYRDGHPLTYLPDPLAEEVAVRSL